MGRIFLTEMGRECVWIPWANDSQHEKAQTWECVPCGGANEQEVHTADVEHIL